MNHDMNYDEFKAYLEQGVSIVTLAETLYIMQDEETMAAVMNCNEDELLTEDELPW